MERDATRRQELRKGLKRYLDQAKRYLPKTYEENPDLMWVNILADTLQLGEVALPATSTMVKTGSRNSFPESKKEAIEKIDKLTIFCAGLERTWVAHQRVFQIQNLEERAKLLRSRIEKATPADWREIQIPFS